MGKKGKSKPGKPPKKSKGNKGGGAPPLELLDWSAPTNVETGPAQPKFPARGLVNIGNTCFMNSVLQCLTATEKFRSVVGSDFEGSLHRGGMFGAMQELFFLMFAPITAKSVVPKSVLLAARKYNLQFLGMKQQDAHEMLRTVLDAIRTEEVKRIKSEGPVAPISAGDTQALAADLPSDAALAAAAEREEEAATPAQDKDGGRGGDQSASGTGDDDDGTESDDSAEVVGELPTKPSVTALSASAADPPTLIDQLFGGSIESTVYCQGCGSVRPVRARRRLARSDAVWQTSRTVESFLDLSLPLAITAETLSGGGKGKRKAAATKTAVPAAAVDALAETLRQAHISGPDDDTWLRPLHPLPVQPPSSVLWSLNQFVAPERLEQYRCSTCAEREQAAAIAAPAAAGPPSPATPVPPPPPPPPLEASDGGTGADTAAAAQTPSTQPASAAAAPAAAPAPGRYKRMYVRQPPEILTLHLKRFVQTTKGIRKLSQHVSFPSELDLAPYCDLPEGDPGSTRYRLYAVIEHEGSYNGGHYMAYARREDGRWYHFSDTRVRTASEYEALTSAGAYVLFYERR